MNMPPGRSLPVPEIAFAALMIAFGIAAFVSVSDLTKSSLEPIGPSAFPFAVSIVLIVLAGIVLVKAVARRAPASPAGGFRRRDDLVLITLALTVAYFLVMQIDWLSFRWATVAYVGLMTAALSDWRPRQIPAAVGLGLAMGLGLQFIFTKVLFLDLP